MNAVVAHTPEPQRFHIYSMTPDEQISTLRASLYPGAKPESVMMVLDYCRATGLDPMLKPVHLVPMSVKTGRKDNNNRFIYDSVDVVMPGIGLYRINAARTGQYAGIDEPVFGPMQMFKYQRDAGEWKNGQKTEKWVDDQIEYPEWVKITVYRIVCGVRCAFTAVEYWLENYATAGRYSDAPNEMWGRRIRGQLAKCVEAQALRKGFPEVGSQPTFEEMVGRTLDWSGQQPAVTEQPTKDTQAPPQSDPPAEPLRITYDAEKFSLNLPKWAEYIRRGKKTAADIIATVEAAAPLTDEQKKQINAIKGSNQS